MEEEANPVHCVMLQPAALQSSGLDHILEHHMGAVLEAELDLNQPLILLEQFHLNILERCRNLYV